MNIRLITLSALGLAFGALAYAFLRPQMIAPTPAASVTREVSYASLGGATDAGIYLADAYGFFKEAGFGVNARVMTSIPSQVAEAATNAVDVSGGLEHGFLRHR